MLALDIELSLLNKQRKDRRDPDRNSQALLIALKAIIRATRVIEICYAKAIGQTSSIRSSPLKTLFERHHSEQRELALELENRIGFLGSMPSRFTRALVQTTPFHTAFGRGESPAELLEALKWNHEWILCVARPSSVLFGGGIDWAKDFAVGRVVLSNDLELAAITEELQHRDRSYRLVLDCQMGAM